MNRAAGEPDLQRVVECALQGAGATGDNASILIDAACNQPNALLAGAATVRRRFFGNQVRMCAIVPGKLGGCAEDCAWCAQSHAARTPAGSTRQRTSVDEIHAAAGRAVAGRAAGRLGIVNAGRRPTDADINAVLAATAAIDGDDACALGLCASLGAITEDQARRLAHGGISRYHHNLETSRRMFGRLVTTHTYDERLAALAAAKRAGLELCCGGLFGLGETWADRVDLALTIRDDVGPASVPLNFLVPVAGTALEDRPPLPAPECLAIIAAFRLIMPTVDLKVAGGRERCLGDQQHRIFDAGATSCMTGDYLTTCGQGTAADLAMVEQAGMQVVRDLQPVA